MTSSFLAFFRKGPQGLPMFSSHGTFTSQKHKNGKSLDRYSVYWALICREWLGPADYLGHPLSWEKGWYGTDQTMIYCSAMPKTILHTNMQFYTINHPFISLTGTRQILFFPKIWSPTMNTITCSVSIVHRRRFNKAGALRIWCSCVW